MFLICKVLLTILISISLLIEIRYTVKVIKEIMLKVGRFLNKIFKGQIFCRCKVTSNKILVQRFVLWKPAFKCNSGDYWLYDIEKVLRLIVTSIPLKMRTKYNLPHCVLLENRRVGAMLGPQLIKQLKLWLLSKLFKKVLCFFTKAYTG